MTIRTPAPHYPNPQTPIVNPKDGRITEVWRQALLQSSMQGGAIVALTPGASPWTYTATQNGMLVLAGSGVGSVDFIRGPLTISWGALYGAIPMLSKDAVKITYTGSALVANFVPMLQ